MQVWPTRGSLLGFKRLLSHTLILVLVVFCTRLVAQQKNVLMENYLRFIRLHSTVPSLLISATCKFLFSILKYLKTKNRSALTKTHLKRIALSENNGIQTQFNENCSGQELSDISQ